MTAALAGCVSVCACVYVYVCMCIHSVCKIIARVLYISIKISEIISDDLHMCCLGREREGERHKHTHTRNSHARNHYWWSLELFELWFLFCTSLPPSLFADKDLALHKILGDPERAVHLKTLRQRVSSQWSVVYIDISVMIHKWWVNLLMTHNLWLMRMTHENDSWEWLMRMTVDSTDWSPVKWLINHVSHLYRYISHVHR